MKNILASLIVLFSTLSLSAQCLYIPNCNSGDLSTNQVNNDSSLWNETYWWDNLNQIQDLPEQAYDLAALAVDSCGTPPVSAKYLLFLDLDGDNTLETVIKSWDPPTPGTVNYNNYLNPNFDGGESRSFDGRAVPADQKYQFSLETSMVGDTMEARLRWNTQANPAGFELPKLPFGRHKVQWFFSDAMGSEVTCTNSFSIRDVAYPSITCINGLSVNIHISCGISVHASDFLLSGSDNATPANLIEYGIRKAGFGVGFPSTAHGDPIQVLDYNCLELGSQTVELWAKDATGNASFCSSYIIVQDNIGSPIPPPTDMDVHPTILCNNGITATIDSFEFVEVFYQDFLHSAYNNTNPSGMLEFGIRKCGQGTGFPLDVQGNPIQSVQFDNTELSTQHVELWARDELGNADFTESYIIVESFYGDHSESPTVFCYHGLSKNLSPSGQTQVFVEDFPVRLLDNVTPANLIEYGIRKPGTGIVFPEDAQGIPITSILLGCDDLGTNFVEIWVRDQDGHTNYTETYIVLNDNNHICNGVPQVIDQTICIKRWCDDAIVTGVSVFFTESNNYSVPIACINEEGFDGNGCYHLDSSYQSFPTAPFYQITPEKIDDPNNGLTALDLVKISKFILGQESLSPYAIIAADANRSNSITTFDIVEFRRLMLGIYQELPNNNSWRFMDANHVFINPSNPFQGSFFDAASFPQSSLNNSISYNFIALKVGDVNCDAHPGAIPPPDDRQIKFLSLPNATLAAGEYLDVPLMVTEAGTWQALQLSLGFDPGLLEIETIIPGKLLGLDENAFAQPVPGLLNLVWFSTTPQNLASGETLVTIRIRARQTVQLSKALYFTKNTHENTKILPAIAYDAHENPFQLALLFEERTQNTSSSPVSIYQPAPNPTSAGSSIAIRLDADAPLRIRVLDLSGKIVWSQQQDVPAGLFQLEIPATALRQTGVYYWQLEVGGTIGSGKIIKF